MMIGARQPRAASINVDSGAGTHHLQPLIDHRRVLTELGLRGREGARGRREGAAACETAFHSAAPRANDGRGLMGPLRTWIAAPWRMKMSWFAA
jgi:hypothetical protein